ncbi:nucleotide exchange factor GrpE [Endozoicomonas ascidiicola]|uniref:nucleotide exchange factor GrpE n=1 Tax=Endozoicomonas ascidiicola TaxID=1698521 RepID=UPI0008332241|nr:nucleotide exchange factor GrpE [Endozoicomonas ascidiicola]
MTEENSKVEEPLETPETEAAAEDVAQENPLFNEEPELMTADETAVNAGRIEELEQQLALAKDQALRATAEAMNTKRRAEQDVEKAHKFGVDKFVNEMIPVVESLEKGIENAEQAEGQHETMLEGMRLTHKQLLDALGKFQVLQVNPEGEPFDPNFHQAISMVPNPDMEPNTVMNVFQKGYTLHGRVIRPAMVVVSKA